MEQLIPGLPDDIALECLVRLPYNHLSTASLVCPPWKLHLRHPDFLRHRKAAGFTTNIIVMAQSPPQTNTGKAIPPADSYGLTLYEPDSGSWSELPPLPGMNRGLPMHCGLVGVGLDLVVIGGYDPETWESSNAVFVYNVVSATWRRGADIPGVRRSFFGCSSDSDRMVLVAGGHDDDKNALRSALAYDVAEDDWLPVPDMSMERDECKVVFQRGKFHVIGGYETEAQGRFQRSAEAFDVASWQWDPVNDDLLETTTHPRTCVVGDDGKMYMCRGRDLVEKQGATWQPIAKLPAELCSGFYLTIWRGKLLLSGTPQKAYTLDIGSRTWTELVVPAKYCGLVQSSCCLEI